MEKKKQKSNNKSNNKKNSIKENTIKKIITDEKTTIKNVDGENIIDTSFSVQKNMKIFLPIILLVILAVCVFVYISYVKKEEKIVESISADESVQETILSDQVIPSYQTVPIYQTIPSGTYFDNLSERATMDVSFKDKTYYFEVNWANSASENMRWTFSGKYDKFSGIISYDNAKCTYSVYDENGNATDERIIFDNGKGVMKFDNNKLYWDDNNSDKVLDAHYNGIFEMPNGV